MKEERFSSGTPSKNKISNFGTISPLYPNFIYHSLSLSLSIWRKMKEKKRRKTFMIVDCPFIIYLTLWKCISLYIKGFMYFNVTTWSKLFFAVSSTNLLLHISFSASIRLMLSCFELSYKFLLNITRETGITDYYNIILLRLNLLVHIFHCLGEGRKATWWVCG